MEIIDTHCSSDTEGYSNDIKRFTNVDSGHESTNAPLTAQNSTLDNNKMLSTQYLLLSFLCCVSLCSAFDRTSLLPSVSTTLINGEQRGDRLGSSLAVSADGTIMASGSPVRVFHRTNATEEWSLAQHLANTDDVASIALSSDNGNVLAVGSPKRNQVGRVEVYRWDGENFRPLGSAIDGEAEDDLFGCTVALSADGSILVVGARLNDGGGTNAGNVRVFQLDANDAWVQMGSNIEGEAAFDGSGFSLSLSGDGSILAIGAPANSDYRGYVRIYKWDSTEWRQMGDALRGENDNDFFGWSLDLSADGFVCAIGAPRHSGNGVYTGNTQVFRWMGEAWEPMGGNILGGFEYEQLGHAVALSGDGNVLAVSAVDHNNTKSNTGQMRIFHWISDQWASVVHDIIGSSKGDRFGLSVAMSADGRVVAAGSRRTEMSNIGNVRIVSLSSQRNTPIIAELKALR